ncbi:MAG: hypothetical protein ACD_45C00473G0001 [uncultured bacterium]|nr:MAG: hypothetical protein ACD_45C00473G0001 [uncultured bacterium]
MSGLLMSYRLSKIYTRTGDDGTTSLGGQERLLKNALRVETLGTLDELNCAIGLALSHPHVHPEVYQCLNQVQHDLFDLGGELCPPYQLVITADKITRLEQTIDQWNLTLPPLKEFVLPRGTPPSASCHLARAICRRAERCMVALNQHEKLNADVLRYINRLSDVLFVAARLLAKNEHCPETMWNHERKK